MTAKNLPLRSGLGFDERCRAILGSLAYYYTFIDNTKTGEHFSVEILDLVAANDDPSEEDPQKIVQLFAKPSNDAVPRDRVTGSSLAPMFVSCAYCRRAALANMHGSRELAWIYLSEASYWCGVTLAQKGIEQAYRQTVTEVTAQTKKKTASAGGIKTAEKYWKAVIDYAYKLIMEEGEDVGTKGMSPNKAALAITELVLKFARENGIEMSDDRADKTIADWLRKMPDAHQYLDMSKSRGRAA
ncbi:hypothetical protein [Burkholderia pseudomallei]|uniref:hypothetical protein n=1 Tax=Burkholderia pseudomallei TaxID=28450 RepID=UPI000F2D2C6C|nr:hypothetical protein [Burkholderia pseudomallei]VBD30883.1 Uncharacterised protein [Burkholderia pseudomallei]